MSKECCKQRFKGVENFLRRVAFNLGNTPSHTEVKIISCIPIDVTDLQQKIVDLEKQLEGVNCNDKAIVNTAMYEYSPPCSKISKATVTCKCTSAHESSFSSRDQPAEELQETSSISLIPLAGTSQAQDQYCPPDISDTTERRKRNFFCKKRSPKKKNTQMIYYTQTDDKNPFNCYVDAPKKKRREIYYNNTINDYYFEDIVRKQYKPSPLLFKSMQASEFSTPICRDASTLASAQRRRLSDMCSCCHGPFQNIDDQMNRQDDNNLFTPHTSKNTYYDSNLYDLVPVKENLINFKTKHVTKTKEPKHEDIYQPEKSHRNYKVPPMIVNYNTVAPLPHQLKRRVHQKRQDVVVLDKMARTTPKLYNSAKQGVVKTCSVDFGDVYAKRVRKHQKNISKTLKCKDAACVTNAITNIECQTNNDPLRDKTASVSPELPDDKTDTLNQIKCILQSVLMEVKTNSKLGPNSGQAKRDVFVQNGPSASQSNMHGESQLLQSFTYSPYSMNPQGTSCSHQVQMQMPINNLYYPAMPPMPAKCMQHYPLFVQSSRMCKSFLKNQNQTSKPPHIKRAASIATNTERYHGRSQETENLIREIYKSVALNIEEPSNVIKETNKVHSHTSKSDADKKSKHVAVVISEIFKNTKPFDTSVTQDAETSLESNQTSNRTSFNRQHGRDGARSTKQENSSYYEGSIHSNMVYNDEQASREYESDSDTTIVNEEVTSSSSETETEHAESSVQLNHRPRIKKKGLFCKIFKMFKRKSKNDKANKPPGSDTDDYHTDYSRNLAYSKVHTKQRQSSRNPFTRMSPLEQEYRRNFDEKLTFHDKGHSVLRDTVSTKQPVYYQNLDTNTAFVKPRPRVGGVRLDFPARHRAKKEKMQR